MTTCDPKGRPVNARLAKVAERFAADPEIVFSFLFGSRATGRVSPQSDFDLAVFLAPDVAGPAGLWGKKLALLDEAIDALETDKVDLVILNEAPPELACRVLREGKLLSCRDPLSLVRFRVRTVNLFLDQQPMRDLFFRYLAQRVKEGRYGR